MAFQQVMAYFGSVLKAMSIVMPTRVLEYNYLLILDILIAAVIGFAADWYIIGTGKSAEGWSLFDLLIVALINGATFVFGFCDLRSRPKYVAILAGCCIVAIFGFYSYNDPKCTTMDCWSFTTCFGLSIVMTTVLVVLNYFAPTTGELDGIFAPLIHRTYYSWFPKTIGVENSSMTKYAFHRRTAVNNNPEAGNAEEPGYWSLAEGYAVAAKIRSIANLKTLQFQSTPMTVEAARVIGDALKECSSLKDLSLQNLDHNEVHSAFPAVLATLLQATPHLDSLNLSSNKLNSKAATVVADFLSSTSCFTLKHLIMNNCELCGDGVTIAEGLIQGFEKATKFSKKFELHTIGLSNNRLGDVEAQKFAELFISIGRMQKIEMDKNGIRPSGFEALAAAVNNNLKTLDLSDNAMGITGAKRFVAKIGGLLVLERLKLSNCFLGPEGVKDILEKFSRDSRSTIEVRNEIVIADLENLRPANSWTIVYEPKKKK
uniref:Leucine-rich repeat, ribonuclease inhibitor subtype n=2 Tax=Panagrellus redivivus TaxID=6233 RepID=A0A7E4ZY87_PANRE